MHSKCVGGERPAAKDYQKFLTEYCLEWQSIGLQLELTQAALNLIDADHRNQHRDCLRLTLESWLQMDTKATWSKLELAITNAKRVKLGIDPLATSKSHINVISTLNIKTPAYRMV